MGARVPFLLHALTLVLTRFQLASTAHLLQGQATHKLPIWPAIRLIGIKGAELISRSVAI